MKQPEIFKMFSAQMYFSEEIVGLEESVSSPMEFIFSQNDIRSSLACGQRSDSPVLDFRAASWQAGQPSTPQLTRHRSNDEGSTDAENFTMLDGDRNTGIRSDKGILKQEENQVSGDGIDGLVLLNSTRLRPAARASQSDENFVKLYIQTYRSLFLRQDCMNAIISLAIHGNLKNNPFRSICWRILLNILPSSSIDWVSTLQSLRSNFQYLQDIHLKNDRMNDPNIDLAINNPLSQADESPWNQHFQDSELRRVIEQDVNRTSPEIDFFQNDDVRSSLSNILFVYAKAHPDISYKQGMHELLAPLFYVVHLDQSSFKKAECLAKEVPETLLEFNRQFSKDIFNEEFLEADVFSLFEALMECVSDWYKHTGVRRRYQSFKTFDGSKPWSRPQDQPSGNKIVEKLSHIQDTLLKRHDPDLYARLEKLEIYPQLYGIRWLRLLFGREFHMLETLTLWDAIFADSCPPGLADQVTVALLMSVRDLLLVYDYTESVSLLMKLPSNISVSYIVAFALHLKDPLRFPRPSGSAFSNGTRRPEACPTLTSRRSDPSPTLGRRTTVPASLQSPRKSVSKRRSNPGKVDTKQELKLIQKTFELQNPRDLPNFTVVTLNQMKGISDEFDRCDAEDLSDAVSRPELQDKGGESLANCVYAMKLQMLKKLDFLRETLRKEDLTHRTKIMSTIEEIQELCDKLETWEYSLQPKMIPNQQVQQQKQQQSSSTAVKKLNQKYSVAQDVAACLPDD